MLNQFRRKASDPARGRIAIYLITVGALAVVWSGVWLFYLWIHLGGETGWIYVASGCGLSGVALIVIGFAARRIVQSSEPPAPAQEPSDAAVAQPVSTQPAQMPPAQTPPPPAVLAQTPPPPQVRPAAPTQTPADPTPPAQPPSAGEPGDLERWLEAK